MPEETNPNKAFLKSKGEALKTIEFQFDNTSTYFNITYNYDNTISLMERESGQIVMTFTNMEELIKAFGIKEEKLFKLGEE